MKIRLAVLDKDRNYLDRLAQVCAVKYSDKIEIRSFTDARLALETVRETGIDVLIADMGMDVDVSALPARCGFAYLADSPDIETYKDQKAVFKYQKVELLYKNILEIYSENIPDFVGFRSDGEAGVRLITVAGAGGGMGASTAAAALAQRLAKSGKRVLYLNLEQYGSTDAFFSGSGTATFNEVAFALKSKKSNLSLKLESAVRRDQSGVCFYAASESALDMNELTDEDVKRLLTTLHMSGGYDVIVIDMAFDLSPRAFDILRRSARAIFVSDGSEIGNIKLKKVADALAVMEKKTDTALLGKCAVLYNKFSSKTGKMLESTGMKTLGGAPRFENASVQMIAAQLEALLEL